MIKNTSVADLNTDGPAASSPLTPPPYPEQAQAEETPYAPSRGLFAKVRRRIAYEWPVGPVSVNAPGGIVSFSFDDFPQSAAVVGASILEDAGCRGTFYAATSVLNTSNHQGAAYSIEDALRLEQRGHEIGCHSFGHKDFALLEPAAIDAQIRDNAAAFKAAGLKNPMTSFAYPYGEFTITAKRLMQKHFSSARGVASGINAGMADLYSLKSAPIEFWRSNMLAHAQALIEKTVRKNGWLIFYTHDIVAEPSDFGATPALLAGIAAAAKSSGAKILRVDEAQKLIQSNAAGQRQ